MKNNKLMYGIGITDVSMSKDGKRLQSYGCWAAMLQRCYSPKFHITHPTYKGCSVCSDWHSYSNFKQWYDTNYTPGYQLDKDILNRGNKEYSPINCRFVPRQINTLLNEHNADRGSFAQGVYWENRINKFKAQCKVDGKKIYLGCFDTEPEAFLAYKNFKEAHIKSISEQYYLAGKIGIDIYNALQNWII